ncbi:serine-threonine protein kinase [Streptomyces sp. NPDC004732]|uniref:serine-threonine protein kinase n=1 Tax=Streptomyces sp. NPDC004732 TaxID=3154290 RepID=UPI0033B5A6D1
MDGMPRRGLVLIAAAAAGVIASGAYLYFDGTHANGEGPANRVPQATSTSTPTGVIPSKYLGTWESTIQNASGPHTRKMVIRQGYVDERVMTLTSVGTTEGGDKYRCVFSANLRSVTPGTVRLGSSTLIESKPRAMCVPGEPSTLTLSGKDRLRRTNNEEIGKTTTYDRSE